MGSGAGFTQQVFLAPASIATLPGVIGGKKVSYEVQGVNVVGGLFGNLFVMAYIGPLGIQGLASVIAISNLLGFDAPIAWSSLFGTDYAVANLGAAAMLVTVRGELATLPR